MTNRLLTPELKKALVNYPLYSQDGKGKDATCVARFFIGGFTWYVLEGNEEGDDFTFFGIVIGSDIEYGYFSANEMASITVPVPELHCDLRIVADESFQSCKVSQIKDQRLQDYLISLERHSA